MSGASHALGGPAIAALAHLALASDPVNLNILRAAGTIHHPDVGRVLRTLVQCGYAKRHGAEFGVPGFAITENGRAALRARSVPADKAPPAPPSGAWRVQRRGDYDPRQDVLRTPARPGATDHDRHPSRRGAELYYRDGRVERIVA